MAAGSRDEGGNNGHEVVVHVARVPKGCRTGRHHSRDLGVGELSDGSLG